MLASLVAALLGAGGLGLLAGAHPLHSALAEIEYQSESESVVVRVRAFSDDLGAAVSLARNSSPSDSALSSYIRGTLALADSAGRPLRLQWQGVRQSGDLMLLEVRAKLAGGLRHARILPALLWDSFPDQVNVVRASYEGRTITLLFTRGDPAKIFP